MVKLDSLLQEILLTTMSGPLDVSMAVSALIWYLSGWKTDRAIFWFAIIYCTGYAIAQGEPQEVLGLQ